MCALERVDGNVTIELPWATTVDFTQSKSHAPILERGLSMKLSETKWIINDTPNYQKRVRTHNLRWPAC